jgi:hypothetical protein
MKVKSIEVVLRKDGFFYHNGKKIPACYPGNGHVVMLFQEPSQIDVDFKEPVLVLSCEEFEEIGRKLKESDEKTWQLRGGKGWTHGKRPFVKLHEFM